MDSLVDQAKQLWSANTWVAVLAVVVIMAGATVYGAQYLVGVSRDDIESQHRGVRAKAKDLLRNLSLPPLDRSKTRWRCDVAKGACVASARGQDSEESCNQVCGAMSLPLRTLVSNANKDGTPASRACTDTTPGNTNAPQFCIENWNYADNKRILSNRPKNEVLHLMKDSMTTGTGTDNKPEANKPYDEQSRTNIITIPAVDGQSLTPEDCAGKPGGRCENGGVACKAAPGGEAPVRAKHIGWTQQMVAGAQHRFDFYQCTDAQREHQMPKTEITVRNETGVQYVGVCVLNDTELNGVGGQCCNVVTHNGYSPGAAYIHSRRRSTMGGSDRWSVNTMYGVRSNSDHNFATEMGTLFSVKGIYNSGNTARPEWKFHFNFENYGGDKLARRPMGPNHDYRTSTADRIDIPAKVFDDPRGDGYGKIVWAGPFWFSHDDSGHYGQKSSRRCGRGGSTDNTNDPVFVCGHVEVQNHSDRRVVVQPGSKGGVVYWGLPVQYNGDGSTSPKYNVDGIHMSPKFGGHDIRIKFAKQVQDLHEHILSTTGSFSHSNYF
jgi:hypothetical protein